MNKYLLEILQDSNTIIIPGLGALTIVNKDTGETMFMPYLQHDDGKLSGFIAEKDGIDEADAKNIVAKYVREIKAELDKGESFSMFELGAFSKKDDGDIEFKNWISLQEEGATPSTSSEVEEPIVDEVPVVEPEPEVETEPEVVEQPEAVSEPEVEPEPEIVEEPEPTPEPEPEPEVIPEPTVDSEPVIEEVEPDEVSATEINPEPIMREETEAEIREAIVESLETEYEPEEIIREKSTIDPSPLLDDIAPSSAVSLDEEYDGTNDETDTEGEEPKEEKKKKKAGVGFWITLIIIALAIIGGGAYIGRNYNSIKQSLFAENDKEAEKNSLKDEISNEIKEDRYSRPENEGNTDENSSGSEDEGSSEDGMDEGMDNGGNETIETEPRPQPEVKTPEKKPEVKTPAPVNVSTSSSGPFKVVAGAFSSLDNANGLAAEYKAKGFKSEVFMKGELHAVSIQSYATSEEANANLSKLQSTAPGAWIYYKR